MVGRTAFSAGTYHYQTDGFRRNFDVEHNVQNLFAQTMVGDAFNVQAEYRVGRRTAAIGDCFSISTASREASATTSIRRSIRVGGRYEPVPELDVLVSYIHADERLKSDLDLDDTGETKAVTDEKAKTDQGEVQALGRVGPVRLIGGVSYARRDGEQNFSFESDSGDVVFDPEQPRQLRHRVLPADHGPRPGAAWT